MSWLMQKKWSRIWNEVSDRVLKLPLRMQTMFFDDILVAVKNRVTVLERISKKERKKVAK